VRYSPPWRPGYGRRATVGTVLARSAIALSGQLEHSLPDWAAKVVHRMDADNIRRVQCAALRNDLESCGVARGSRPGAPRPPDADRASFHAGDLQVQGRVPWGSAVATGEVGRDELCWTCQMWIHHAPYCCPDNQAQKPQDERGRSRLNAQRLGVNKCFHRSFPEAGPPRRGAAMCSARARQRANAACGGAPLSCA
jgi:hypothetical protein